MTDIPSAEPTLKRSLSLTLLTLYGLGTTIGAGIYALIGKVAGRAGIFAPISFLLACLLSALTAFAFAELASRLPRSAGEALYVREGFRSPRLGIVVGLMVASAGCISAAAIVNAAVGYINQFVALPASPTIALLAIALGLVAAWGITESVLTAALFTLVEIGGLLLVIAAGAMAIPDLPRHMPEVLPPLDTVAWAGIVGGTVLAFYAFLGFEDMVNVAEEVKDVRRTMPLGIILTLGITTLLYFALAVVAVLAVPPAELAVSDAPLALLFERSTGASPAVISGISVFAILNGALVQMIMASRVIYGLAEQGSLPRHFGRVHRHTRTPLVATGLVVAIVLMLGLGFPIEPLAEATSLIVLMVFALVNLALIPIKRRHPHPDGVMVFPDWIPWAGFGVSAAFIIVEGVRLAMS